MGRFLTDEQFNALAGYISQRPWREASQLMQFLMSAPQAEPLNPPPAPPETMLANID
jgi:hypothetical protein